MKPLFTGEEIRRLRRIDENLERAPLTRGELREADARDEAIAREGAAAPTGGRMRAFAGGADLAEGWFERARAAKFASTEDAARACGVGVRLMWYLECGSTTAPELARRIGRVLGLAQAQTNAITCQKSVERRRIEAKAAREAAGDGAGTRKACG